MSETVREMRPVDGPAVCRPTYVRRDDRGTLMELVDSGPWETILTGSMRAGAVLGNHYHKQTRVRFFLIDGEAEIRQVDVASQQRRECRIAGGSGVALEPHQAHAIRFLAPSRFIMLKSRRYRDDDPDTYPHTVWESASGSLDSR